MKIFIFGAGASVGSQEFEQGIYVKAPVTNQIFTGQYLSIAEKFGLNTAIFHEYAEEVSRAITEQKTFEDWLSEWWDRMRAEPNAYYKDGDRTAFSEIAYYLWHLFQKVSWTYTQQNGYTELCRKIKKAREDFSFISFNYDTLLDRAVEDVFHRNLSGSLESYSSAKLLKPHGSVNWYFERRQVDAEFIEGGRSSDIYSRLRLATELMLRNGPFNLKGLRVKSPRSTEMRDPDFMWHSTINHQYFFPVLYLPLKEKQSDFIDGYTDMMVNNGKAVIAQAHDIYLIGYRAADKIISEMFAGLDQTRKTNLHVIGNSSNAILLADRLQEEYPSFTRGLVSTTGFADFVRSYNQATTNTPR